MRVPAFFTLLPTIRPCVTCTKTVGRLFTLMLFLTTAVATAQDPVDRQAEEDSSFQEEVRHGILFVDGKYIAGPYLLIATRETGTINGFPLPPGLEENGLDASSSEDHDRPRRRFREAELQGGFDSEADDSDAYSDDAEYGGSRRSGRNGRSRQRPPALVRNAMELAGFLNQGAVIVATTGGPSRILETASDKFEFFEVMLATNRSEQDVERFLSLVAPGQMREDWRRWLQTFVPDSSLRRMMTEQLQEIREIEAQNRGHAAALIRLAKFSYPLTVIGMFLGVVALGHMLKWAGRGLAADEADVSSPENVRYVVVALFLMLGMSCLDLVWTILAGQAGIMKEVNPLAAGLVDSPARLAILKVVATGVGFGILFAWRQRRQIQQATWWMCLVCILLTFRWVIFDSMNS